jgi:phosphate transport system permease protein
LSDRGSGQFAVRRGTRRFLGGAFGLACLAATLTGVVVLAILLGSVLHQARRRPRPDGGLGAPMAIGALPGHLLDLASKRSSSDPTRSGFKVGIYGSLWLLGLVAAFSIPVGVGAAVYLEEFAPAGRLRRAIQVNIANLAGVPSIVYGILGLAVFVRAFGAERLALGKTLWAGALTLGLLVLPVIVIATQEALRAVPPSLRQAALALGATRWQVVRDHVLPSSLAGILTGTILALSRAIGETAPLLLVGAAGSILVVPKGPSSFYTALPVEIYNDARDPSPAFQSVAAGGILVLLVLLLSMNAAAILIRHRHARQPRA